MQPETRAGRKAQRICSAKNITLAMLRRPLSWDDREGMRRVQSELGIAADGLFWKDSATAFAEQHAGYGIRDHDFIAPPDGVQWLNFLHTNVHAWGGRVQWMKTPDCIFVHESVTTTWQRAISVLTKRHLSVCLVLPRDGDRLSVFQHCDLYRKTLHAGGGFNNRSVSCEVIGPYYGRHWHPGLGGKLIKPCDWSHKGKSQGYITPTDAQIETLSRVIEWLWDCMPTIPRGRWVGERGGEMVLGKLSKPNREPRPGVWAHHYTAHHADGAYPVAMARALCRARKA